MTTAVAIDAVLRNALIAGGLAVALGFSAQFRKAQAALPLVFLAACAGLTYYKMLDRSWALESLQSDADWRVGAPLVGWMVVSGLGLVRLSGWPATVAVAAVLGDRFAALGLVAGEADPARRARLVLAASGASLVGFTGGPASLVLGWGGWQTALLGLVLAAVGWAGAPLARVVREAGRPASAVLAGVAGVSAIGVGWVVMVGGTAEQLSLALEQAPLLLPRAWRAVCAVAAVSLGAVVDEGGAAMIARATLDRGLDLASTVPADLLRAGIAVGGGLPLLLLTRSRLRTGLPLWLLQVVLVVLWAQWGVA